MQYVLLFLEGIITFISPCLLPMLPIYISFFAAEQSVPSAGEHQGQVSLAGKRRAVINVLGFVLGFTIVFVILGAFAGTVGLLLVNHTTVVNIVTGLIVVFLGLNFIGIIKIGLFNRSGGITAKVKNLRFFSAMLFGIVFSITWTPCVGAFLGAALGKASMRGGIVSGIVMLLVYSLGLGIPFVVSAVLIDRLKVAFDFIKRHYRVINIVSGIVLVIMGVLMAAGLMGKFLSLV
ncbi:MAG: cytochrome c biogenesis protein CcdA [Treponema sp.]|nr:cytochrome c biogenesis protein CcdA [Treponema sp.]